MGTQAKIKLAAIEQMGTSLYELGVEVKAPPEQEEGREDRHVPRERDGDSGASTGRRGAPGREAERAGKRVGGKARMPAIAFEFGNTNA